MSVGWNGFGLSAETWAIVAMGIALIVTLVVIVVRRDIAYSLVVIWAFAGILIKRLANPETPAILIITITIAGIAVLAVSVIIQIIRYFKSGKGIYLKSRV